MRFHCGPTWAERRLTKVSRLSQWHKWFAWRPVRINAQHCVWLEFIERKGILHRGYDSWWTWEYRIPLHRISEDEWK